MKTRKIKKTIQGQTLYRAMKPVMAEINKDGRTVPLSFASETPVERWFGMEILDMSPECMRLERANNGLPLFVNHNPDDQVGRCNDTTVGKDRVGRCVARFGNSQRANEIFQDVLDEIRTDISVGYRVYDLVLEEQKQNGPDVYRATDWEPYEISIVGTPADISVGIGRGSEDKYDIQIEVIDKEVRTMEYCPKCGKQLVNGACPDGHELTAAQRTQTPVTPTVVDVKVVSADADKAAMQRVNEIIAMGERHNCMELAHKAIKEGKTVELFRNEILETVYKAKPIETPDPLIGMSSKDMKRWSILRAIDAAINKNWATAGFEKECSDAVAKRLNRQAQGFFIPYDVMTTPLVQRDMTKGAWNAGGALVETDILAASFIELLRNKAKVVQLGATVLGGLVGDIAIPKQTGAATAYWVAESGAPTESQQTLAQVGFAPKTVGAFTDISRKLLLQSSIDVEAFVRSDLATVLALAKDLAAINGKGTGGEPQGILKNSSVGVVAAGTNGAALTWANIVAMETAVATANADVGTMAYLTNAKVRGALKATAKASNYPLFVWADAPVVGSGMMNGYRAEVSNQVPGTLSKGTAAGTLSAVIFGVWASLIIAEWGTLDVLVDPYTGGASGTVRVRVLQDTDIGLRHAESFCVITDALA
jgi:HK97 family phage major capsid protein